MKKVFMLMLTVFLTLPVFCQKLEGFDFTDRNIDEILYSLSMYAGIPIAADDTVEGQFTFHFAGKNIDNAFDSFLLANRLFVNKENEKWTVSRISIKNISESNTEELYQLQCLDVNASRIIEKLSSYFCSEISYSNLSENNLCVNIFGKNQEELLEGVVRQLGEGTELFYADNIFSVVGKKSEQENNFSFEPEISSGCTIYFNEDNQTYTADISCSQFCDVLENFFREENIEYVLLENSENEIQRIKFYEKNFEDSLDVLCRVGNMKYFCENGIYYFCRNSANKNADSSMFWKTYLLSYSDPSDFLQLAHSFYEDFEYVVLPSEKSFCILGDEKMHEKFSELLIQVDKENKSEVISLKYITASQLLQFLPPGIKSSMFTETTQDNVLFFTGSESEKKTLLNALNQIDVPVKRLSYDLLVMQYQYNGEETWESSLSGKKMIIDDEPSVSGVLGSVLSLNLDVLSAFGYKFAYSLQTALNENKAHIFADTKLHGVSGQEISFKNTNTFRYRDNNLDPETGIPIYSGVTREIVSGLTVEVTGWISGDGMITSSIVAAVTRQGTDLSSKTGNPPPTSEKIIRTEVRGKSGEPIILSGLLQNEESSAEEGVPLLSNIPLVGKLFSAGNKSKEKTEMVIYLVPHWLKDEEIKNDSNDEDFFLRAVNVILNLSKSAGAINE